MKEIFTRFAAETPVFFKRMRNVGLSLTATGTSLVAIPGVPDVLKTHASTGIWVGAVMAALSQLTVKDPPQA